MSCTEQEGLDNFANDISYIKTKKRWKYHKILSDFRFSRYELTIDVNRFIKHQ